MFTFVHTRSRSKVSEMPFPIYETGHNRKKQPTTGTTISYKQGLLVYCTYSVRIKGLTDRYLAKLSAITT